MCDQQMKPNDKTFNALIDACVQSWSEGNLETAKQYCRLICEQNVEPNDRTFNALMDVDIHNVYGHWQTTRMASVAVCTSVFMSVSLFVSCSAMCLAYSATVSPKLSQVCIGVASECGQLDEFASIYFLSVAN